MKKTNIYIASFLALTLGFSSCSDEFLNLEPLTGQVEANFYKTEQDGFLAVTSIYDAFAFQNWQCPAITGDITADDAYCGGSNSNDMGEWQEMERSMITTENNAAKNLWLRCYKGIYRANLYMQKQEGITFTTDGLKDRFQAEAMFLRGYMYFDLARHYGWVPIITSVLPNVEDYKAIPQNTPTQVYSQAVSDIEASLAGLPETVSSNEIGRITKPAAKALLARIYLYYSGLVADASYGALGLAPELKTASGTVISKAYVTAGLEEIIASGNYSLVTDYSRLFAWDNQNNEESLLEIQYNSTFNTGDWGGTLINGNFMSTWVGMRGPSGSNSQFDAGWSFGVITWGLYNEYTTGDLRRSATIWNTVDKPDDYGHGYQNTGYFNYKYMCQKAYATTVDHDLNHPKNFVDIRYADVLLMAAELQLGDAKAVSYVNEIRSRAGLTPVASVDLDLIYHERRCEFGGEGLRKWDLLRRGLDYTEAKINASFVEGTTAGIPAGASNLLDFAGRHFDKANLGLWPIPAVEIRNANAGVLKQYVY